MAKAKQPDVIPAKNIFFGNADAPVTLLMYGDYESEACAKANEAVKKIMEDFDGQVKFTFRHFPQTQIHQKAMKASEASMAAAQEGKFWEMHNKLFEQRRNLGTVSLKLHAKEVGVTNKKFLDELVSSKYSWYVRDNQVEAWNLGLRTVPAFYVNGEKMEGAPNYNNLKKAIEIKMKGVKKRA